MEIDSEPLKSRTDLKEELKIDLNAASTKTTSLTEPITAANLVGNFSGQKQNLSPSVASDNSRVSVAKAASEASARALPYDWLSFLIPLFFSVAMITVNAQFYFRHLQDPTAPLVTLNRAILYLWSASFFLIIFSQGLKKQAVIRTLFSRDKLSKDKIDRINGDKNIDRIVKAWFKTPGWYDNWGAKLNKLAPLFSIFMSLIIGVRAVGIASGVANIHPFSSATLGLILVGFCASLVTAVVAFTTNSQTKKIRSTYLYFAQSTELSPVLKTNYGNAALVVELENLIDFDAFADIQRWFKRRFSQKSWKKTAFIVLLVLAFIVGDGVHILISTITFLTSLLGTGVATNTASVGTTASAAGGGFHVFNNLLLLLSGGGLFAYFYAIFQPTHLKISPQGIDVLYRRKTFGKNIKRVAWTDMKTLTLVTKLGTTLVGEKTLKFEGDRGTLLKFKLNCVDSVVSREKILHSIEQYAPKVQRDAEIIQILQRPAEQSYTDLWLQTLASPPKRDRLKPLVPNSVLQDNRYTILRALGLGGQGTAYLATDSKTKQTVVLKEFILPIYVDMSVRKSALERFENEARILQKLNHDQIVKLSDFFVEDHRGYLALDYIEGADLKKVVEAHGKLNEANIVPLAVQMCEILRYLHAQTPAVIHRDFTPDNLILQPDGRLMLIDFNVAQQTSATVTGTIVGKQCYLPPEQFQGDPVIQSDIYAMGATIYFLCTGTDPEPISQSRPSQVEPGISQGLNMFVANCTTIDPELRYKNADECLKDLKRLTVQNEVS